MKNIKNCQLKSLQKQQEDMKVTMLAFTKCADEHPGFSVFDENGKAVYSSVDKKQEEVFRPYLVRVEIPDLNILKKPGTDQEKTGKYTGADCFTIVVEADGVGASKWGC